MRRQICVLMLAWAVSGCTDHAPGMDPDGQLDPPTCEDADGDGYGVGDGCVGPDCDDGDASCWAGDCCLAECAEEGESVPFPGATCCEGLKAVPLVFIEEGQCSQVGLNIGVCVSNCGDGVCEQPAEPCACPEDC